MATDDIIEADGTVAVGDESMFGATSEDTAPAAIDDDTRAALDQAAFDQYEQSRDFGQSWAFDFDTGMFIMRGNAVAMTDGLESMSQWANNVIRTERFTTLVYSDDIGIESEDVFRGQVPPPMVLGTLQQRVKEALMVHDRVLDVTDFTGDYGDGRTILIGFNIHTTAGSVRVEGTLGV